MKHILITGKDSYIGTRVELWLKKYPEEYSVDVVDTKDSSWRKKDFRRYDVVYHVAGIVHVRNASVELYEKVNHRLAVDVAQKASEAGVRQFIFMSTGAVFSQNDKKHRYIMADEQTELEPSTEYGLSKKRAEEDLRQLGNSKMKVAIIRPPMVYGPGAKGNYNALSRLARVIPVFPKINNKRSMLYIDNLCEFIRQVIDDESCGVFMPQNKEYVNTTVLVEEIAKLYGHRITVTPLLNWMVKIGFRLSDKVCKVFGDYTYASRTYFDNSYQIVGFKESLRETEKYNKKKKREQQ